MNCPTTIDLLEYLTNDFQGAKDKARIQEHVEACVECQQLLQRLEQEMKNLAQKSEEECEMAQDHLLDHADSKIAAFAGIDFKRHLGECERCGFLSRQLDVELSREQVMALEYPVPKSLRQRFEQLLHEARPRTESERPFWNKVEDFIDRIVVTSVPAPAPAFLGNVVTGTRKSRFAKGHWLWRLGKPAKWLKFSLSQMKNWAGKFLIGTVKYSSKILSRGFTRSWLRVLRSKRSMPCSKSVTPTAGLQRKAGKTLALQNLSPSKA